MPLTDPIADFLTRMRNAQHGRHTSCRAPWSTIKQGIAELLHKNGYLGSVRVEGEGVHRELVVDFLSDREPLLLKRISKPGIRKYVSATGARKLLHGHSLGIISTSSGLLTHKEALEKKVGGELLCTIS